jgi:hypothetical protein
METGHTGPTIQSDFQHLLDSLDEMSRNELPEYFIQSMQTSVLDVRSMPSVSLQPAEERSETCNNDDDEAEDSYVVGGVVPRLSFRDWRKLESARYRLESAWYRWLNLYRDSWQRRFSSNVHADTSDSDCDSPRSSIQDFRSAQDLRGTRPCVVPLASVRGAPSLLFRLLLLLLLGRLLHRGHVR